jgi:hypothetical protein
MSDAAREVAGVPAAPASSGARGQACVVRVSAGQAVAPAECACCGGIASRSVREGRPFDAGTLLVPYCGVCHAHVSEGATRSLSIGVASGLLALTLAVGLPLLWQPPALALYAAVVALGAFIPHGAARAGARRARARDHAALARAVWFRLDGALVCASADWGRRLARGSGREPSIERAPEPIGPRWALVVALAAVLSTPFLYGFHFPRLRVLNLTDDPLTILVDGVPRARVPRTGSESAHGGIELRVPAGRRLLLARTSSGRVVDSAAVVVESGERHLYAPGSRGTCFWLETTGYGQSLHRGPEFEPLGGEPRFWVLRGGIDFWFASAPAATADARSSGGVVRALRQAPCGEAPEAVRSSAVAPGNVSPPFATDAE